MQSDRFNDDQFNVNELFYAPLGLVSCLMMVHQRLRRVRKLGSNDGRIKRGIPLRKRASFRLRSGIRMGGGLRRHGRPGPGPGRPGPGPRGPGLGWPGLGRSGPLKIYGKPTATNGTTVFGSGAVTGLPFAS